MEEPQKHAAEGIRPPGQVRPAPRKIPKTVKGSLQPPTPASQRHLAKAGSPWPARTVPDSAEDKSSRHRRAPSHEATVASGAHARWVTAALSRAHEHGAGRQARARGDEPRLTRAHWPQQARRTHARTHAARPRPRPAVGAPRPPQRPLGGARWGPARPARSFTYSKRHPCGRPTAPTSWALLPSPSPAGAPGTPTSSAPSRPGSPPASGPAAAAVAAAATRDPPIVAVSVPSAATATRRGCSDPRASALRPQPGARRLCHPLGPLPALTAPARGAAPPTRPRVELLCAGAAVAPPLPARETRLTAAGLSAQPQPRSHPLLAL